MQPDKKCGTFRDAHQWGWQGVLIREHFPSADGRLFGVPVSFPPGYSREELLQGNLANDVEFTLHSMNTFRYYQGAYWTGD